MVRLDRMLVLCLVFFFGSVAAQSPAASASASASASAPRNASISATPTNASLITITTTLLSTLPTSSGRSQAQTATLVITLTLNSTALPSTNASNLTNDTLQANETAPWNSTMDYLPFKIVIDPAYGVLGGILVLTGIPVAMLGGKNRWSSLAITSGYTLLLFCLVMVLRFGVEPALQGPSPNPPTRTLRGLYLLAGLISSIIGSAIGIFFWKFAQYWVNAAGGFAFAWFIMATRADGVVRGTVARWGLIGALTLLAFLVGLWRKGTPWMLLASTAWIGATAFTLGIDCFIRGGLKEFYVYNLGFHDLFPKLGEDKYPLTQTMQVELGVLAAMVVIGAAIQFKILNVLQAKLKQMRDLEAAERDAKEEAKAAERFKDVQNDLGQWEAKHGNGGVAGVPMLGFESDASLLRVGARERERTLTPATSMEMEVLGSPTASAGPSDPELEDKIKLLAEVQRIRRDVRGSIDQLRSGTPTFFGEISSNEPQSRRVSTSSGRLLESPLPSPTVPVQAQAQGKSEWDAYLNDRKLLTPPSGVTPPIPTSAMHGLGSRRSEYTVVSEGVAKALERRQRTMSAFELGEASGSGSGNGDDLGEWGVGGPKRTPNTLPVRAERAAASDGHSPITTHFPSAKLNQAPVIIGHARVTSAPKAPPPTALQRTLTYEELDARHRRRLSKLQAPVTDKMQEEVDVAEARDKWARANRMEREEMKRRERERAERAAEKEGRHRDGREDVLPRVPKLSASKKTEEWRKSVAGGLDAVAVAERPPQTMSSSHRNSRTFVN